MASLAALAMLLPGLTGCLRHTYRVPQPKMPPVVKDATADQLVQLVNRQSRSIQSLKASVTFQVSVGGAAKGKVTDYTSFSGYILLRTPEMLRVLGLLPVVHTQAFDLASNGKDFTLVIPHDSKAYTGPDTVNQPSTKPIENLRPNIFFDTMILQTIAPDDLVYLTNETLTKYDAKSHQLLAQPEYELNILQRKASSQELIPERRIHFDRTTLLPDGVDIYDAAGDIQTRAVYGPYASFGDVRYPGTITITRPIDEYQIVLTVEKLTLNEPLATNQFEIHIPEGYTVQQMH